MHCVRHDASPAEIVLGSLASGGRESAVSAPSAITDAVPRSGKQGADAPRSRNNHAASTGGGEFLYGL